MSAYNEKLEWLDDAIDSICNQTFGDFEFLIVDDNPNREELKNYLIKRQKDDERILIIFNDKNIGLTKSLNKALKASRGDYLARMDADDVSALNRFDAQINFLKEHEDVDVCGSALNFIGNRQGVRKYPKQTTSENLIFENPLAHSSVMIRRESLGELIYDERFRASQDFDLWTRLLYSKKIKFFNFDEPLVDYRISNTQVSSTNKKDQRGLSKDIRRRAYIGYTKFNGLPCKMDEKTPMSFGLKKDLALPLNRKEADTFLLYCYTSIEATMVKKLKHLFVDGDIFRMSLANVIRMFYYDIKGIDASRY